MQDAIRSTMPAGIKSLMSAPIAVRRRHLIRGQDSADARLYYLHSGWAATLTILSTGRAQTTEVHLPGSVMGWSSLAYSQAADEIVAVTDCEYSTCSVETFERWLYANPARQREYFRESIRRQVDFADRMSSLAHCSAQGRLAAFFASLYDALSARGLVVNDCFDCPLSQPDIADAAGMTPVHANRMLRQLREDGILSFALGRIQIMDHGLLRRRVELPRRKKA